LAAAQHPCLCAPADDAVGDATPGDRGLPGGEELQDLCVAERRLDHLRLEHAGERLLDVLEELVDHLVLTHVDLGRVGDPPRSRAFCATRARAAFSSGTTRRTSPASGTSGSPRISTGREGSARPTFLSLSSTIARTLPNVVPATTRSPRSSVPVWTRTVATGPRPLSRCASI